MDTDSSAVRVSPSPTEMTEIVEALDHFNGAHADTVVFIAQHVAKLGPLRDGELVAADFTTVRFQVQSSDQATSVEWSFPEPVSSVPEIQAHLFTLLGAARAAAPDGEPTSLEREMRVSGTLPTTHVTVRSARLLTPWLRELTLQGLPGHLSGGGDEFVLVIPPEPGQDRLPSDATMQSLRDRPADQIPPMAYYTVREWDHETDEVTLWCVLHDHDGGVASWVATAAPGDPCALWGPREGFAIGDASTVLLAVDETGIPAAWAVVEAAGPEVAIRVIAEVPDDVVLPPVPEHPGLSVEWHSRAGAAAGTTSLLTDAIATTSPPTIEQQSELVVLAATETRTATAIRRMVRDDWGLPATQVSCVGYWRRRPTP